MSVKSFSQMKSGFKKIRKVYMDLSQRWHNSGIFYDISEWKVQYTKTGSQLYICWWQLSIRRRVYANILMNFGLIMHQPDKNYRLWHL